MFSDADVRESARRLREALGWSPEKPRNNVSTPPAIPEALGADEKRFLDCIAAQPCHPSSAYASISGLSPRKAIRLRKSLCRKGLLREWAIDTVRGGKTLALVPLQRSSPARSGDGGPGRGGPLHRFAVGCIAAHLSRDHWVTQREVAYDAADETTFVDLVATRSPGEALYIEFELRPDYADTNIRKDFSAGLGRILVVTATRKVEQTIRDNLSQTLSSQEMDRVDFSLLSSFLREG